MIGGKPHLADRPGEAQPAVVLHRSRVHGVALGVGGHRLALVHDGAGNPPRGEFERQDEPYRPPAANQNLCVQIGHAFLPAALGNHRFL